MKQVSVYLDGFPFHLRPRHSDWSYVEKKMPRVTDWAPGIRFVHQTSPKVLLRANFKAARAAMGRRLGLPQSQWAADTDYLDQKELARSGCDLVFSHREFPLNAGAVPVVWMSALVDPPMIQSYFRLSQAQMDEEAEVKGKLFRRATVVQVCTEAEAARHARLFPDIAGRFVPVPLFGPHLRSAPESVLQKHRNPSPVRLLFVGNDPRRKGLQETVQAYLSLPESVRRSTLLTVVSHFERSFDGSRVTLPDDARIRVHRGLPAAEVLELMRTSHILLNVSHCESYGMTFLEAMSQGTLCIGPDWEVQRELFDAGRAGINVRCDTALVRDAMLRAIEDEEHRLALASAGWRRFNQLYAPPVVAERYADLFRSVASAS